MLDFNFNVLTEKYNRFPKQGEKHWQKHHEDTFSILSPTFIGGKRKATRILYNEIETPKGCELFRDPLWWYRWYPLAITPNSYRLSSLYQGYRIRAELILKDGSLFK